MKKSCDRCGREFAGFPWETMCYTCKEKEAYDNLCKSLQENKETETTGECRVICPWCGDSWDPAEEGEGPYYGRMECVSCGKEYDVTYDVTVTYSTTRRHTPQPGRSTDELGG
jgi:hypothetical protein